MIGSMANDDPEGMEYYQRTKDYAEDDPNIHLLSNLDGIGNVEVNAFQRVATVVLQKSLREGFGLTVAEGLWKHKPVIGGNVGGIPLQIEDGKSGFLVRQYRGVHREITGADTPSWCSPAKWARTVESRFGRSSFRPPICATTSSFQRPFQPETWRQITAYWLFKPNR